MFFVIFPQKCILMFSINYIKSNLHKEFIHLTVNSLVFI